MAKTQDLDPSLVQLKTRLQEGKVVIGTAQVHKRLQAGKLTCVYLSSNCPKAIKETILHLVNIEKVLIEELKLNNEELGVFCKKNFFVSVLGITK